MKITVKLAEGPTRAMNLLAEARAIDAPDLYRQGVRASDLLLLRDLGLISTHGRWCSLTDEGRASLVPAMTGERAS